MGVLRQRLGKTAAEPDQARCAGIKRAGDVGISVYFGIPAKGGRAGRLVNRSELGIAEALCAAYNDKVGAGTDQSLDTRTRVSGTFDRPVAGTIVSRRIALQSRSCHIQRRSGNATHCDALPNRDSRFQRRADIAGRGDACVQQLLGGRRHYDALQQRQVGLPPARTTRVT